MVRSQRRPARARAVSRASWLIFSLFWPLWLILSMLTWTRLLKRSWRNISTAMPGAGTHSNDCLMDQRMSEKIADDKEEAKGQQADQENHKRGRGFPGAACVAIDRRLARRIEVRVHDRRSGRSNVERGQLAAVSREAASAALGIAGGQRRADSPCRHRRELTHQRLLLDRHRRGQRRLQGLGQRLQLRVQGLGCVDILWMLAHDRAGNGLAQLWRSAAREAQASIGGRLLRAG